MKRTSWSGLLGLALCAATLAACSQSGTSVEDGGGSSSGGGDLAQPGGGGDGEDGGTGDTGSDASAAVATLKVAIDDPANLDGPSVTSIDVATVRDLLMRLEVPSVSTSDVTFLTFTLKNPNGVQQQKRRFAFSTDASVSTATDPTTGQEEPVTSTSTSNAGRIQLDFSIPVAGTNLQTKAITGTWHLTVDVDGHPDYHVELDLTFTSSAG